MVEERLGLLYRTGKVVGGLYGSLGQEAISVGTSYALEPEDWVGPMIRNLGIEKMGMVTDPLGTGAEE